ncbi:hypothetical protein LPJ64_001155 [Coemansia asiatica]|uniref:Sec39 domain-containing protein n=1 Tax=Coemansia asiatica TaxID=1052880 RepID=A0A9W7XPK7_9FUNG|nr:hypothetical protein LPJ64_001155 [Coemansia asiatica]
MRLELPATVLLRISACTSPEELSQTLSTLPASQTPDAVTLLRAVAECFDAQQLLPFFVNNKSKKVTHVIPMQADNWEPACIERAESIDQWTGRIDWAIEWLEQVLVLQKTKSGSTERIRKTLDHAYTISAMQAAANDVTLRQVNAMDQTHFIEWLVAYAKRQQQQMQMEMQADVASVLNFIFGSQKEYLNAWNEWWKRQLGLAPWHHELFRYLVEQCPETFAPEVLLASVLSVAGPCNSIEYAQMIMSSIDDISENHGSSVRLKDQVIEAAQVQGDTEDLVNVLESLDKDALDQTKDAVLSLTQAITLMQKLGFNANIHQAFAMQTSEEMQRRTLVRVIRSALQTTLAPETSLWKTLLQLYNIFVFHFLTVDQIKYQYLLQLLVEGQLTQARDLIDAEPCFAEPVLERDAACQAVRELIDGSELGDSRDMTLARKILTQTLSAKWQDEPQVVDELALIDASQLCATLRRPGDPGVVPAEIRLAPDAYTAVETVLKKCPSAYCRPRVVREIANLLLAKTQGQQSPRVKTMEEALVCSMMLQSAVSAADFKAAYEFSRSLQSARSVLASAVDSSSSDDEKQQRSLARRTVDSICAGCLQLAESWTDGAESRRLEALALALRLCPAHGIPEILDTWRRIAASSDWWSPALDTAANAAESVRLALLGPIEIADASSPVQNDISDISTDVEAIRSFDPAIIRRCLRHSVGNADARCGLLLEWLDFSLTTTTEPRSAKAVSFRQTLERTLVDELAEQAIECLDKRVLPQIDQTNHTMVQAFYLFYARLSRAVNNSTIAEQAEIRAELAAKLRLVPSLCEVDFARLIDVLVNRKRRDVAAICNLVGSLQDQILMAETLVLDMALVRPFDNSNIVEQGDFWQAEQLASAIALNVLMQELDQQRMSEFTRSILCCTPLLKVPEDKQCLEDRVAFDSTTAALLGIDMRQQVLVLVRQSNTNNNDDNLGAKADEEKKKTRASIYIEFLTRLASVRDSRDHEAMTQQVLGLFDTAQGVFLQSTSTAASVWRMFNEALQKMIVDRMCSAYLVLCTFQYIVELLAQWDDQEHAVDELGSVYSQAIDHVIDQRQLLGVFRDVLELDITEGMQLKKQVGEMVWDIVCGTRAVPCSPDAQIRLELLDLYQRHCSESGDHKVCDIRAHLLAQSLWNTNISVTDIRDNKKDVWTRLLDLTNNGDSGNTSDRQIDTLVEFLAEWGAEHKEMLEECVVRLLVWAAKNNRPERVVVAMLVYPRYFDEKAGGRAFDELLGCVGDNPRIALALAVLGMTYPVGLWAERCMEPVIMVLLHEPAISSGDPASVKENKEEYEEEADGWGLDEDDDNDNDDNDKAIENNDTDVPEQDYAAAREQILQSSLLHICIMLKGFVPATLASPELLTQVGQTCLWQQHPSGNAERQLLDTVQGGMAELLRRTVHVLSTVGLEDLALAWTQVFLHVPRHYRFFSGGGAEENAQRWIELLDCVVLGKPTAMVQDSNDEKQEEAGDYEPGWGESDVELELELEDHENTGPREPVVKSSLSADQKTDDNVIKRKVNVPETPQEEEEEEEEAAAWGDDDIDLDAEFDNVQ